MTIINSRLFIGIDDVKLGTGALGISHGGMQMKGAIMLHNFTLSVKPNIGKILVSLITLLACVQA